MEKIIKPEVTSKLKPYFEGNYDYGIVSVLRDRDGKAGGDKGSKRC